MAEYVGGTRGGIVLKLLTYQYRFFGPRAGLKQEDRVVDLTALLGADRVITDVGTLLRRYDDPLTTIWAALADRQELPWLPLSEVTLCPPIPEPPCVRDSSLFEAHSNGVSKSNAHSTPKIWYERPIYFYETTHGITGPEAEITRKSGSVTLDYEAELAVVIGKGGKNVSAEDALDHIFGVMIYNDWTDRAIGGAEVGFLGMHKSKDFAAGMGPWIVTMDELADRWNGGKLDLKVDAWVNGVHTTDSRTGSMYWSVPQLLEVVTQDSAVEPGDIIGLGTVGTGCLAESGGKFPFLQDGDTVEIQVEGIGTLRQHVKRA